MNYMTRELTLEHRDSFSVAAATFLTEIHRKKVENCDVFAGASSWLTNIHSFSLSTSEGASANHSRCTNPVH